MDSPFTEKSSQSSVLNDRDTNRMAPDEFDWSDDETEDERSPSLVDWKFESATPPPSTVTDGFAYPRRTLRVEGGRSAQPRRIVADYDSDDARLIDLKRAGYTDEYVSAALIEEGRIRYHPRTICTRWARLRRAIEAREEETLDDELSDWHLEEDDILHKCIVEVESKIEKQIKKVQSKKWSDVSRVFAHRIQQKKYSAKACMERYEALEGGTALLPIEVDPDQEGRAKLRKDRIADAKATRAAAIAEDRHAREEAKRISDERKATKYERSRAASEARQQSVRERNEIKAARLTIFEERRKHRLHQNAVRRHHITHVKWAAQKHRAEIKILDRLVGRSRSQRTRLNKQLRNAALGIVSGCDDDDSETGSHLVDADEAKAEKETPVADPHSAPERSSNKKPEPKRVVAADIRPGTANVTKSTLENPRSIMSGDELELLLVERNLPRRPPDEDHAQVVARLAETDSKLIAAQLNDLLRSAFLSISGSRADRVRRLQRHDASQSELGGKGVKATDPEFKSGYEGYDSYGHLT